MPVFLDYSAAIQLDAALCASSDEAATLKTLVAAGVIPESDDGVWILHPHILDGSVERDANGEVSYRYDQGGCI